MKILKDVKTYEGLRALLVEIDAVKLSLAGSSTPLESVLIKSAPKHAPTLLKHLRLNNAIEREVAISALVALEKQLDEVQRVELILAFIPSEEFIDEVFAWVTINVGSTVLLDFKKDPAIIAGAVISYGGQYLDDSTAKKLTEVFSGMRKAQSE